eukprot:365862-Chlamydomonas_euryale.AAC.16
MPLPPCMFRMPHCCWAHAPMHRRLDARTYTSAHALVLGRMHQRMLLSAYPAAEGRCMHALRTDLAHGQAPRRMHRRVGARQAAARHMH